MKEYGTFDHDYEGSEYDWGAVDKFGHLGFFSTGGAGWIPLPALSAFDNILDKVNLLPEISQAAVQGSIEHWIEDWIAVAKRGFFAFDWNRRTERYEVIAVPVSPLLLQKMHEEEILNLVSKVRLDCNFTDRFEFPSYSGR